MSVTLYTTAWGDYWNKYGASWTENIKRLNTKPDRIFIVSDKVIDSEFEVILTNIPSSSVLSHFRNIAVINANTEWLISCDLDDTAYPNLIDDLNSDYDIHNFCFESSLGHLNPGIESSWNNMFEKDYYDGTITGTSAIKIKAIKECGMYPDIEFEDAGLWCKMRKNNKSILFDPIPRFMYTEQTESLSRGDVAEKVVQLHQYFNLVKSS